MTVSLYSLLQSWKWKESDGSVRVSCLMINESNPMEKSPSINHRLSIQLFSDGKKIISPLSLSLCLQYWQKWWGTWKTKRKQIENSDDDILWIIPPTVEWKEWWWIDLPRVSQDPRVWSPVPGLASSGLGVEWWWFIHSSSWFPFQNDYSIQDLVMMINDQSKNRQD